jgi:hypothetical protein
MELDQSFLPSYAETFKYFPFLYDGVTVRGPTRTGVIFWTHPRGLTARIYFIAEFGHKIISDLSHKKSRLKQSHSGEYYRNCNIWGGTVLHGPFKKLAFSLTKQLI